MKNFVGGLCMAALLSACASAPDHIAPSYVSPLEYSNLDCDQLRAELIRVSDHVREVAGVQAKDHTRDQIAMGVGLVVFWPALFFLSGGGHKDELARLKGEYDALDQAAIEKKCAVADEIRSDQAKIDAEGAAKKQHGAGD